MPYTDYLLASQTTLEEREKRQGQNDLARAVLEYNAFKQITGKTFAAEETSKAADSTVNLTKAPTNILVSVGLRGHRVSINCATLPKVLHPAISNERPFFHLHVKGFNADTPNFDRLGVLYELRGRYFTICECANDIAGESASIQHQWLCSTGIGKYIKGEWDVLPKEKVGDFGMGVAGEWGTGVHSQRMMQARKLCLEAARKINGLAIGVGKTRRRAVTLSAFQMALTKELSQAMNTFFGATCESEKQEEEAMSLFVNFDMIEG